MARHRLAAAAACAVLAVPVAGLAAEGTASPGLTVELNKLEPQQNGCRAYLVVSNDTAAVYQAYKLDLVLFQPDGVIGRRFVIDLAPLKATKKTVKLFDLDGLACDKVGSLLINDVVDCKSDAGPQADCLAGMTVKSITNVQLSK